MKSGDTGMVKLYYSLKLNPVEYNQQHNSSWDSIGLDFRIGLGWIGLDWIFSPSKTKKYTVSLYIYYI